MSVGFTGTRAGMTLAQERALRELLRMVLPLFGPQFRHGVARGADVRARDIAVALGYEQEPFPAHDDPLARNRVIVSGADFMMATPAENREILRSGTWATIRHANKTKTPGITIWPDGTCSPMVTMAQPR